jgi:hypothetical protein
MEGYRTKTDWIIKAKESLKTVEDNLKCSLQWQSH